MAVANLQSSNVFAYSFTNSANTHNHYVLFENNPAINLSATNWTIEFWIKPYGNYSGYNTIFAKRLSGSSTTSYEGYLRLTSGVLSYFNGTNYESSVRLTSNTWNHVAYVFNNTANLQIYLNGTNILTTTAVTSVTEQNTEFVIGAARGQAEGLYAALSNFRIIKGQAIYTGNFTIPTYPFQLPNNAIGYHAGTTNVASSLTGNVVLLTCNDQFIKSNGNTRFNVTAHGIVSPTGVDEKELQNFSYYFPPGANNVLCTNNVNNSLNLNTDFTIEMWYYPTSNSGVLLERGFRGFRNNSASYIIVWDTPNNNLNFAAANANNNTYSVGSLTGATGSLGAPTLNAWNHVAVTRAGNNYRGFLNGNLNFTSLNNANTPYFATLHGISIGGAFPAGTSFAEGMTSNNISGYISNLRIIRGNSVYNAAFTPARTQLLNNTNVVLLTALTPAIEDVSLNFTLTSNGMSGINISTLSPFTANAVVNNSPGSQTTFSHAVGFRQSRIYDKIESAEFAMSVPIYAAVGQEQGRIYDKIEDAEFAMSVPVYAADGQRQGRIYDKIESTEFAYIPTGGGAGPTGNIEYQFWS